MPSFINNPDWLLAGFDAAGERFHFAEIDRQTYTRSSFLDHRINPLPQNVSSASAAELDTALASLHLKPATYLFHTAFCASTLLASCLDHAPETLVLKEPLVLSRLAGLKRDEAGRDRAAWSVLVHRVSGLLDRSYGGEAVIVKPSNFANALIADLLGDEPGDPASSRKFILMSCSLHSLLISILKKQDEAERSMPAFLEALLQDSDYNRMVPGLDLRTMNLLQQSAIFWHCQRYQFQQVMKAFSPDRYMALTMEAFLSAPLKTLMKISGFLGLPLRQSTWEHTVVSGAFRQHSKDQESAYGPGQRHQEAEAVISGHRTQINEVLDWVKPILDSLPPVPLHQGEEPLAGIAL